MAATQKVFGELDIKIFEALKFARTVIRMNLFESSWNRPDNPDEGLLVNKPG